MIQIVLQILAFCRLVQLWNRRNSWKSLPSLLLQQLSELQHSVICAIGVFGCQVRNGVNFEEFKEITHRQIKKARQLHFMAMLSIGWLKIIQIQRQLKDITYSPDIFKDKPFSFVKFIL